MTSTLESPTAASFDPREIIDHPSGFLALSAKNRRFSAPGLPGFIAYRERGRHFVSLGGVYAADEARGLLLDGFLTLAKRRLRRVIALQVRQDQTELFRRRGFTVNRFGASYAVRLPGFSCAGTRRMRLRQKVKRARDVGLRVLEVGKELPADGTMFNRLREVSDAWLRAKHKKEIDFMIGELGAPGDPQRRIFVTNDPTGRMVGFITYVPVWGRRPGYLHDLTRRLPDAPPGAMELCNLHAMERLAVEGAEYLHFGFTPFVVDGEEGPAASRALAWVMRMLWRYGEAIYPAQSQVCYKLKWAPEVVEPEFIACRPLSLRAVLDLLLLTRSI
ncbi:MAG TPA: DUF2156 domain-containing protein [Gemmataceae bacterium]|jgi:lysylphosphatidylglycerol synthetase-like protein (DUF2156 family)|nr:DUF2156 domain-containing protein [Gemmataceae bacterium]